MGSEMCIRDSAWKRMGGRNDPFRATLLVSFKRQREFHFDPERTPYACGPTAVEEVPVLPIPWCLCVCVPVCPFVPVSICLWVRAGGCPETLLVSVSPSTSVLCESYGLTAERAPLGLGLTDRFNPRRQFFTAPCGCGLQHRGPWGRSQTPRTLQAGCPLCSTERGSFLVRAERCIKADKLSALPQSTSWKHKSLRKDNEEHSEKARSVD